MNRCRQLLASRARAAASARAGAQPYAVAAQRHSYSTPSWQTGASATYIDKMYEEFQKDPSAVHSSWRAYFETGSFAAPGGAAVSFAAPAAAAGGGSGGSGGPELVKVWRMVEDFRERGHLLAQVDPLELYERRTSTRFMDPKSLLPAAFGFADADLDREIDLSALPDVHHLFGERATVRQIESKLKDVYCGEVGFEFEHISNIDNARWLQERIERFDTEYQLSADERIVLLDRLTWADHFENFLKIKWGVAKRFGLDGAETMVPCMKELIDVVAEMGGEGVVIGMPHRGRLNTLATVIRKPLEQIFHEFQGNYGDQPLGTGDVKYHLGMSMDRLTRTGKSIHLSMVANPSHLEAVNPVVMGKTRARQHKFHDTERKKQVSMLLHGDASFSAQGIIYECATFTDLPDYTTGGVLHIVVNNQIGFTTDPLEARSSPYCTDVGKCNNAPIFHVNGDRPEEVVKVAKIAAEYRMRFNQDVIIDLVCYRRYGHNEGDEPKFTQPFMYNKIAQVVPIYQQYRDQLVAEGAISAEDAAQMSERVNRILAERFEASAHYTSKATDWLSSNWGTMKGPEQFSPIRDTGYDLTRLRELGTQIATIPEDFAAHKKLRKIFNDRLHAINSGEALDWGTAESLAFASLLDEGFDVRLSGEDVERGTFSHRHAVLHDQEYQGYPGKLLIPMDQRLSRKPSRFSVYNSPLSEYGVLGFEAGYSLEDPSKLVIWEAQFGDFYNGGQIMVDQFISSGESKWLRQSGLVMLLPHGMEGGGPEHSSGRIERFLAMCDDDVHEIPNMDKDSTLQHQLANWQVVNVSTPANFFHVLRRQMNRDFRKPLVVFSPKSLLKLKACSSPLSEFGDGTKFQRVIPAAEDRLSVEPEKVRKLVFTSGKVYYDMMSMIERRRAEDSGYASDIAIARLEQYSPFPYDLVQKELAKYPNAELVWAQEEPKNNGAFTYVAPRFETAAKAISDSRRVAYTGRPPAAAPATGFGLETHKAEQDDVVEAALM